ncbi:stage III sporulation protein AE [Agathobaculum sp.]|uniref:stage III sporulation protein AE n=1 Tax=Agathobaculum sp. TaxID=2048138 RepID=UPI002A801663|nr:hypothetical protein [Agathobaculum sp.]MDY3618511.1 hypothetical protein [Agathobaculum sp.]
MKKLFAACLLAALLLPCASAAGGQTADGQTNELLGALPAEQRQYLDGVPSDVAGDLGASFGKLLDNLASDGQNALQSAVRSMVKVAVIVALTACARGFSAAAGGGADAAVDMAGALGCGVVLLTDFSSVLAVCREALSQISVFSATLQPVLAAALSVGGCATTATVLQVATMLVFDLVIRLVTTLLVPAVCAYLAIIAVDAATSNGLLRGLADGVKSLTAGSLKLILTLFITYITVAGGVSGSVDRMALKTAKFAVSGAVPVVGGILSDATETMLTGAALLKNTVGVFGMLCVTAICLVPFLRAGACYLCYKAGAAVLSPLCSKSMEGLLGGIGTGFGLLLGMLSTCSVILYFELVYVVAMVKPI